jgi:hypothetical protein
MMNIPKWGFGIERSMVFGVRRRRQGLRQRLPDPSRTTYTYLRRECFKNVVVDRTLRKAVRSRKGKHETPSVYRSVKTGSCAAVLIHSRAMMTSKMKLCLLQLLRRDILLLLIHTWAWYPSLVTMRSFYSFLSYRKPCFELYAPIPRPLLTGSLRLLVQIFSR